MNEDENIIDHIHRLKSEYIKKNHDEYLHFLMTGEMGETLITCPECRKRWKKENKKDYSLE